MTVYDMTGVSARGQQQAALHEVLIRARQGQFTALLCWALDRLTREGAEAFLRVYRQFNEIGCQVISLTEPWTETADPLMRELVLGIMGSIAKMESDRISARTKAGMERAREQGVHLGRPKGAKDKGNRKRSGYYLRYEQKRGA